MPHRRTSTGGCPTPDMAPGCQPLRTRTRAPGPSTASIILPWAPLGLRRLLRSRRWPSAGTEAGAGWGGSPLDQMCCDRQRGPTQREAMVSAAGLVVRLHRRRVLAARVRQRTARRKTVDGRFEGRDRRRIRRACACGAPQTETPRQRKPRGGRFKPGRSSSARGSCFPEAASHRQLLKKEIRPQFSSASSNPLNDR
jgi:hypothetical protein